MYPYFNVFFRQIPAYGTMMMLGLLAAGTVGIVRVCRAGLRWEDAIVLLVCGFGFAIFGAAGLYIGVTYSWREILTLVKTGEMFTGEKVGLVFYGGLIGCIPGVLLGKFLTKARLTNYVSPMIPCIPLGHAFGRLGCLLAGCCYGLPVEGAWGVIYPEGTPGVPHGIKLLPVQAIESLILVAIFGVLMKYCTKRRRAEHIIGLYAMMYASARFILEWLRYDAVRGHWGTLSTSQWISIVLFAVGITLWRRNRRGDRQEDGTV